MTWRLKALMHSVFSIVPWGDDLHYFVQRRISKSLPTGDKEAKEIFLSAKLHVDRMRPYFRKDLGTQVFFEFGAGWDMMIPLTFYAMGIERQIVVDIRPLMRPELVNATIVQMQRLELNEIATRVPSKTIGAGRIAGKDLGSLYGISFRAPCDARSTGMPDKSVDCITSTNTLEHIPRPAIEQILKECRRILADGGTMSFRIDYQDHYSYFDSNISAYNFLQYSKSRWRFVNPALHYQNRLRHPEYLLLFRSAGFEIVEEHRMDGSTDDLALLSSMAIEQSFRHFRLDELAVRKSHVILRKGS